MFTGLIEEQGEVKSCTLTQMGMELSVLCTKVLTDISLGASICINGACQSVTAFYKSIGFNDLPGIMKYADIQNS